MFNYQLNVKSSAAKEFKKLPLPIRERISETIDKLREEPRFPGVIKLQGDAQLYRVRVGDYRVVFSINDREKILTITRIRHRQDVYEK
ncbi:MAG: type II toxin-antitoxin system RelE/ParE family toxin [Snowella sp.]|jgi:mRNA interferase RelE/StbE|nr:type II toxin-antitoxin system RelE/ParE family toxin [Snowella sp.]PZV26068.1 MAG: type II toxin-antitoxin system mRNA interferase toxin, RelE/StbE family [Snowella sp.]